MKRRAVGEAPTRAETEPMRDALRLELERRHRRYLQTALGVRHPLSRVQELRAHEARARLVLADSVRTYRDAQRAAAAVGGGRAPSTAERDRLAELVDASLDGVAEARDEAERLRDSFAVSLGADDDADDEPA